MSFSEQITRSDAEALIPEPVSREIIKSLPASSIALTLMRRTTMSSKTERLPVLAALAQAYWVSGDTGLKQTTKQAWDKKMLVAEELAAIVPIPEAVIDDAAFDVWGEIRPELEAAVGAAIDAATLFGLDKPASWTAPALVPAAAAAGNEFIRGSVQNADVAADVNETMALVEDDGFPVTGFASDITLKAGLRGLRSTDGVPIFQASLTAGTPSTLYGEPIAYVTDGYWDGDEADLIAGNFRMAVVAVRQDFRYKILDQAVITDSDHNIILNLAQQDMVALRVTFRVAYQVANPINRRKQVEATRFPFAVLRPTGFTPEGS